jgi:hypothetical protein
LQLISTVRLCREDRIQVGAPLHVAPLQAIR